MATGLLNQNAGLTIHFHTKWHPTFISDATSVDALDMVQRLTKDESLSVRRLGEMISRLMDEKRLRIEDHLAWNAPILFNKLPTDLITDLDSSDLVVFKGDANYRRLVLDTKWPTATSFEGITSYLSFPRLALRTVKAELCTGMEQERFEEAQKEDIHFQENGKWGVIHFGASHHAGFPLSQ